MKKIIKMLDEVYKEITDNYSDTEERQEVLGAIDDVQFLIDDLEV
jgi:uncharacterized protein (DUF1499 family)